MSHVPPSCQSILGLKVDAMPVKQASVLWTETSGLSEEMDRYDGKTVRVKGLVARDNKLGKNAVILGRHIMTCCADDIAYSGLVCNFTLPVTLETRDWITVTAKIRLEAHKLYGGRRGPVLYALEFKSAKQQ